MAPTTNHPDIPASDLPISLGIFQHLEAGNLTVSQAPWSRFLTIEAGQYSRERRRYRILLAVPSIIVEKHPVDRLDSNSEGQICEVRSSRSASMVIARMPSGYFVKCKNERPSTDSEEVDYSRIITGAEAFSFFEDPPILQWKTEHSRILARLRSSHEFWAAMKCIALARTDRDCNPVLRVARDELCSLQAQLGHIEDTAFLSALERSTTTEL